MLDDLTAPDRAYAFFTFVTACNVLAARVAADGHRTAAVVLAGLGAAAWLSLTYTVPVRLILGPRVQPVLAGVNGTWFIWVVGTQWIADDAAVLDRPAAGYARLTALLAVLMWSVGVVLYLMVATLVLTRLLLLEVKPDDLTPPYWVTMGATAITVLAAAKILAMAPSPAQAATGAVVQGLGLVLWAFGTWLIPLLVAFGIWRHVLNRVRLGYVPALWSIVFPLRHVRRGEHGAWFGGRPAHRQRRAWLDLGGGGGVGGRLRRDVRQPGEVGAEPRTLAEANVRSEPERPDMTAVEPRDQRGVGVVA